MSGRRGGGSIAGALGAVAFVLAMGFIDAGRAAWRVEEVLRAALSEVRDRHVRPTTGPELFRATIRRYRDDVAPRLSVTDRDRAVVVACGERSVTLPLPASIDNEAAARFEEALPVLRECTDGGSLKDHGGDAVSLLLGELFSSLDSGSFYLSRPYVGYRKKLRNLKGDAGLDLRRRAGRIEIGEVVAGGAASRAGLKEGDGVEGIDGKPVDDMALWDVLLRLRGEPGTSVTLRVRRAGRPGPEDLPLALEIPKRPEAALDDLGDGIAHVRLPLIDESAGRVLDQAARLRSGDAGGGLKGLLLDLRDCNGGLYGSIVPVAGRFLETGDVIVSIGRPAAGKTGGKSGEDGSAAAAVDRRAVRIDAPVVVLVNGRTASAGEAVARALKAKGRAVIAGVPTMGKGYTMTLVPFAGGSAALVAESTMIALDGVEIEGHPLAPDVIVKDEPGAGDVPLARGLELLRERVRRAGSAGQGTAR